LQSCRNPAFKALADIALADIVAFGEWKASP